MRKAVEGAEVENPSTQKQHMRPIHKFKKHPFLPWGEISKHVSGSHISWRDSWGTSINSGFCSPLYWSITRCWIASKFGGFSDMIPINMFVWRIDALISTDPHDTWIPTWHRLHRLNLGQSKKQAPASVSLCRSHTCSTNSFPSSDQRWPIVSDGPPFQVIITASHRQYNMSRITNSWLSPELVQSRHRVLPSDGSCLSHSLPWHTPQGSYAFY